MKLIGYLRVSTDKQADNTSLEEQRARIEAYCQAYGHELAHVFTEVGSGGCASNRPQFQTALDALEHADGLIAMKLDRLARNTRDVLTLVEDVLQPKDKALILLDLNVDTSTPTGKMILTVMAAVATLERDVIRERTQSGRKAKARAGGFAFGSPPYGFKSVEGTLVQKADEQAVIKLIRRHRQSGKSFREVAAWLNRQGIPTRRGMTWQSTQVSKILRRQA